MNNPVPIEPIPQASHRTRRDNHEGHYRERADGRWECQFRLPGGKRKSLFARTKAELKIKHTEAIRQLKAGIDIGAKPETMAKFLHDWLEDVVKPYRRPRTHASYAQLVRIHIEPAIGHIKLRDLKQPAVDAMLRGMTEQGYSPRTVQYVRAVLRAALNYALGAGLVERNAAQYSKTPARKSVERDFLTAEQSQRLIALSTEHDSELTPLLTTALYSGLRIGELAGLRWQDVDMEARTLRVRQTVGWLNGKAIFGEPKTERSRRTLMLPRPAIDALKTQSDRQAFLKRQAGDRWRPYDLVFASVLGTPIEHSNVSRRLRKLLTLADLPQGGFHMLRHSCASLLLAQGVPMRLVMEQLGHSQMSLTTDLYSHVAPVMLQANADALERALGNG